MMLHLSISLSACSVISFAIYMFYCTADWQIKVMMMMVVRVKVKVNVDLYSASS